MFVCYARVLLCGVVRISVVLGVCACVFVLDVLMCFLCGVL